MTSKTFLPKLLFAAIVATAFLSQESCADGTNVTTNISEEAFVVPTALKDMPLSSRACDIKERWVGLDKKISGRYQTYFHEWLKRKANAVMGFADGLSYRKTAKTQLEKAFYDYAVARSFYEMGLIPLAHQAFQLIITQNVAKAQQSEEASKALPETAGVTLAA